ncbi:M50 family metallopeptidase [Paenarthrobacter sp. PH39-S1]|uniref:M50 family metallopeptidase n=1 Tax=Paenarthrobacter sp. PH39-S1 TaxID=3046204 RepID=UPI0024B94F98|nr:M50 family metallopeptidase [Paenarthrobacter sp. PH39-S1]MDJ0355575.1 M50 family metallopeptidase [Paenarthrobacter sp. PH39-S1]
MSLLSADGWTDTLVGAITRGAPLDPAGPVLIMILAAAVVLAVPGIVWRHFGIYVTVVHELGHAFAALLTGQRLTGIRIRSDQSGTTHTLARGRWPAVWSGFWGYPAPAAVGAALVLAALTGWQSAALLAGAVVVLLALLFVRNWFGALAVLVCAAVSVALLYLADGRVQGYVLLVLGAALLLGAVLAWFNVIAVHLTRRNRLASSDAYLLYRRTGIPSVVWLLLMGTVIAACAWAAVTAVLIAG